MGVYSPTENISSLRRPMSVFLTLLVERRGKLVNWRLYSERWHAVPRNALPVIRLCETDSLLNEVIGLYGCKMERAMVDSNSETYAVCERGRGHACTPHSGTPLAWSKVSTRWEDGG